MQKLCIFNGWLSWREMDGFEFRQLPKIQNEQYKQMIGQHTLKTCPKKFVIHLFLNLNFLKIISGQGTGRIIPDPDRTSPKSSRSGRSAILLCAFNPPPAGRYLLLCRKERIGCLAPAGSRQLHQQPRPSQR